MFSNKKFTDIYKITPNAAKARDNGDFSNFWSIYSPDVLKVVEKELHREVYSCVWHCLSRLSNNSIHYNRSDLIEECIAFMQKQLLLARMYENGEEGSDEWNKIHDEVEFPRITSEDMDFDEWIKSATTKKNAPPPVDGFSLAQETVIPCKISKGCH